MIDLYFWTTPNGYKPLIFLEEAGLPYRIVPVNISKGEQFRPEFLEISPNNRIPAIVDHGPMDGGSSPGRSCSIWRRRPASFCPGTPPAALK
jgi:GST-like protein